MRVCVSSEDVSSVHSLFAYLFQLTFRFGRLFMEFSELFAFVVNAERAILNFLAGTAFPYFADATVADVRSIFNQTANAVYVLGLYFVSKLF